MEYQQGNVQIRPMQFAKAGEQVQGHAHNFTHVTYVCHGAILVEKLNAADEVIETVTKRASDGYNFLRIDAGVKHRITALPPDESFMAGKLASKLLEAGVSMTQEQLVALLRGVLEEDETVISHCIYSHRNPQGEVVVEYDGWRPAYR